jgi:hypothetical protein
VRVDQNVLEFQVAVHEKVIHVAMAKSWMK